MDIQELIKELNDLKITQKYIDITDNFPEKYDVFFHMVEDDLDIDRHRWYELSTTVFNTGIGYMGVTAVSNLFSEQMDVGDCYITLEFYEMKQVKTVTYKAI